LFYFVSNYVFGDIIKKGSKGSYRSPYFGFFLYRAYMGQKPHLGATI